MARQILTLTKRELRQRQLREAMENFEYHPGSDMVDHIAKLNRMIIELEECGYKTISEYRVWVLYRSLPPHWADFVYDLWMGHLEYQSSLAYCHVVDVLLKKWYQEYQTTFGRTSKFVSPGGACGFMKIYVVFVIICLVILAYVVY